MEDKRKTVYEVLKNKTGYKDSFEDFNKVIDNDENARTKVYDVLKNKTGYKDSFDDFNKFLGLGMAATLPVKHDEASQTVLSDSPVETDIPGSDNSYTYRQYDAWAKLTPDARKTLIGNSSFYDEVERRIADDKLLENAGLDTKVHPDSVVSGGVALPIDSRMVAERNFKQEIRGQLNEQIEEGRKEANTQLGEVYDKDFDKKMKFQRDHPFLSSLMDMSSGIKFSRSGIDTSSPRYANEEAKNLNATINKLDDAQDVLEESARKGKTHFFGGLLRGLGKKVFDISTWDAGATDMLDTSALLTAATDKESGKQLSHSQNLLLDAAAVDMAVDENFAGDLGRGYKAGQVTAESVPFMLEFMINPASGLGETVTKSIVKRGIQKYGKDAMKTTIKKIEMGAVRAASDLAGAGIMSATTGSGRVVADTQNRMIGDVRYDYDENGYIHYADRETGESLGTALAKAYGANVIENYSEMLGRYFSPLTDAISGVASRGLEKIGLSKVNRFIGEIKASDWGRAITDFERRTQWNGNLGEYAEEVAGGTLNALFIGDQTLDTDPTTGVFNLDNNIDTLLGVSMMGGFLSGVRTFGYRTPKYKARKSLEKAEREAESVFGNSWEGIKGDIENADESNIISVLSTIYQSDEYKPEQKEAAIRYASSLKNFQGANLADLRRRTDGDVNEIQLQTENSYDNGCGLNTPEEKNDAKIALEGAIGAIMESHPDMTEEDVISTVNSYGNTPSEILSYLSKDENGEFSSEYVSQVTSYLNAKAQYDGVIDNVRDGMEGEIESQVDYITKNTHSDGNIYNATLKVDDRRVYVTGGNIVMGEDGVVDYQQSDKSIVIRDAQTGKLEMIDVHDIQNMQPGVNAEQHKAQIAEQIKQDYVDKAAAEINGVLPFNPGDTYIILNAETGAIEELVVQQVEGDLVTVTGVDGKEVQTTKEEVQALVNRERMLRFKEQYQKETLSRPTGKKILDDGRIISATSANESEVSFDILDQTGNIVDSDVMPRDEYDSLREIDSGTEVELGDDGLPVETDEPLSENPITPEQDIIEENGAIENNMQTQAGLPQETEAMPVQEEVPSETQENAVSVQKGMDEVPVIPVDEKGNLQYHKVPMEMTIEDITSPVEMDGEVYNPTEEEVTGIITANKDEAIKLYEKLNSKPPKIGANKTKYFAEKKQWNEQVADAKKQVDYWNEVEAHVKTLYEKPGDTTANEIKAMGEPMNGEELAAMMLGAGKLPLLYGEYKRETGFGNVDAKNMFGLFASKEKGGMTIEQAGEQLMLADLEAGTNFFDQNDPNAGRNAIIDVLSSARTRGGLINYIKSNREAMAERERQAEAEADELAKEQWYQDNYHMTPEEYELWDQGELFAESNVISDEEYQEFMSNFVDEILNEQENDRRTSQESGSSIAESESNEQEGVSGVREPGSSVLQGEESVSAGTIGRTEKESSQVDANSGTEHDTLQSSPSGRELISPSRNQESVPDTYVPSRMEGESLLDYAGRVNDAHALHKEEQKVDTNPTDAQKEAGNYKKGHIKIDGFDITIENPRGSERSGVDAGGNTWSVTMNNTYGYIRGTEGVDGDHIDVFLGDTGNGVYVVDQVNEDGSFDEHKVMYGFASMDEAKEAYLSNYSPGWKGLGNITGVSKETFKEWIDSSHRKTKPFAEYKIVQDQAEIKTDEPAQDESNIRFREVKEKDGSKSLVGLHNISGDKLRKALKLGGFANPSAAVIDIDKQSHEGYGEISLVLPSSMVAKNTGRNAGTFSGDAWTPTYPQIERKFTDEGSKRVYDDISKLPKEMQSDVRSAWNGYMEGRDANALAYQFLYEKGEAPKLRKIEPVFSEDIRKKITGVDAIDDYDERNAAILKAYIDEKFDGDRAKFEEYIETRKRVLQKKIDENPTQKGFVYRRAVENLKDIEENGYEYNSVKGFYDEVMSDIRKSGGIDTYQTVRDVQEKISQSAELSKEYNEWKENLADKYGIKEVLFKGYTPSGNRVYLPHTLENVSKMMRQQGLAGATGWGGSFSKFAAGLMKPVGTLNGIRQQKGKLTTNHEEIEAFREKWEKVYFDLGLKLNPDASSFDDTGLYRVEEIATKPNSRSFAKREYGVELSDEDVRQLSDMVAAIRNEYPAMYFETKFERPVYLNEFAAAVVPDNASKDIVDAMNGAGIKVFTYKAGDETSRNEAVENASHINGVRFREDSMKTYHGSGAEFDKFYLSHSGEGEGESMIGKGIYTTRDKRIAEEYAGVAGNREVAGRKHLYEVEIPADNGGNYLDYDKVYGAAEMSEIARRLHDAGVDVDFGRYFHDGKANGMNLYMAMAWNMPEGVDVNRVLNDAGYVGYKYSTRHDLEGKEKRFPKKSYVVFDESNAAITGHEQIVSEIEKISDTLHTPVKIVRGLDELPEGAARKAIEKGRNVKGWFDTKTGEVVIYLPNAKGEEDAKATFLHEIVGHKGLRALFGEKSYDDEMVKIYGQLPVEVRKRVADGAIREYGGDIAIAMDEFLAEQAEKNEIPSWWDKVVSSFRDFLRKMGISLELSDNDVRYLLWRSRKNLERNNPLEIAADVDMRNKLGIGEYGTRAERFRETTDTDEEDMFAEQPDENSVSNPSLLDAYKKRIFELNARISSLERKIDSHITAEELSNEVIEEIKKEIGSDIISEIGKGELSSLLLQVKNAKTKKSLEKIFMNVKRIALSAQSRKLQRMMDKMLSLKVQDVNGKNMSIAKNVDDSTRRIFSFIRGKLSDIKKSGLEDDILYLKRDNRKQQEEIRRLEGTIRDTSDISVKDEALAAIDQSRKIIEENKERIQELRNEKNELEKQIAASSDIDVEKEMSALNEKMDRAAQGETVWTQGDSERMAALNIISGQIMNKSHDFEIQSIELDIQQRHLNNSNLYKDRMKEPSENKRRQINNTINENRRQVVALERLINDTRAMQVKQLQMTIEQLEELISNGKNSLLRRTEEEVKRKCRLIGRAIETVDGKPIDIYDKKSTEEGVLKKFFSAPLGSFEYMCKRVNTKTLGKDGFLYKYFVAGKDGVMKAYDTYVLGMEELRDRLDNKSKEIFGEKYDKVWTLSDKAVNSSGVHIVDTKSKIDGGYGVKYEIPLSKGQAMYIYQVWKMNDGRTKLEMQGFDEESIVEIRDFIGNDYIKFADWIQEELLPELREKYNAKYLEMYGTSLADIKDYVPLRIVKKSTRQESDLSEDKERRKTLEERAGSLIKRVVNTRPVDITMNAFDVLFDHGRQMEEWNAYARVRRDLDAVLSNTTFRNQLDANTRGSFHNFYDAAAVATKTYHPDQNKFMDEVLGKLSKGIVGGNIAWRLSTALKQVLSAPAFWGYFQSPIYMKSLLVNAAKMPVTFKWCMDNIPSFRERVFQGTAGNEKLEERSISKYLDKYIETGMIPNKLVDAVTCSIGAKSIYDYRYGQLVKQGLAEDEARNQALMDADIYYNQTQQSSHPAFLSPMQMSRSIMDRMITTYQNSNIGYVRKVLAAYYDLTRSLKWKELQKNYTDMYVQEGMNEDEASSKAYRKLLNENKKTAFEAVLFAWGMNLLWNIGSKGLLGFFVGDGDDDDNDLAKGISFFLTSPIKGMPGGNLLESIASGYGMNPLLVYDELDKFMKEVKFAVDEYGLISPEIAFSTMERVSRYGGVDLEVLGNIYLGVEGLARDGALSDDKMIDFMYMLNSPKSNRAAVAKELYKDESVASFAEKVARANKYISKHDSWEGWVPGTKDLTKRRKKDIEKEYERFHMTDDEKKSDDEKKIADKHRRKLKELDDDPFALADYIDSHREEHNIYRKYY